jgi:hypothetical protein
MSLEEDLLGLIRNGDARACIKLLRKKSEVDRAKAAPKLWKAFEATHALIYSRDPKKGEWLGIVEKDSYSKHRALDAAQVALLGTTSKVEGLRKFRWRSFPREEFSLAILRDRKPIWLPEWADLLCELAPHEWPTIRALVKDGLLQRPTSEHYVLGMMRSAPVREKQWNVDDGRGKPIKPLFERDPDLLKDEIWHIFEVEGNRDISLTGHERFWMETLLELSQKKKLDRGRLLDSTLAALARDFPQHKAGFHSRMHDALKPTPKELAARTTKYVALLTSRIPPTVSFAARAIDAIADADLLEAGPFIAAAPSARGTKAREVATKLVKLLGRIGGEKAALAAVQFLENESTDVVDAVLDVLTPTKKTKALGDAVKPFVATVPASRRKKLDAWLGATAATPKPEKLAKIVAPKNLPRVHVARAAADELAKAPARGPWPRVTLDDPAPRLDPSLATKPIADHDELVDAVARALEAPEDRLNVERMLDGISRLGRLPEARVKPLLKRAETQAKKRWLELPRFLAAWLLGAAKFEPSNTSRSQVEVLMRHRLLNILARVAKNQLQPLLALPSTDRFFVSSADLLKRYKAQKVTDRHDAIVAWMRLAPDGRPKAFPPALKKLAPAPVNPSFTFEWSRRKSEYSKSGLYVEYNVHVEPKPRAKVPVENFPLFLTNIDGYSLGDEADVRDAFSLVPNDRRALFAWGVLRLRSNVDWGSAEWENHVALEPLIDPDTRLEDVGLLLLAIGTNTREPRENALATDALIAAIEDGRVVGPELAAAMASLWHPCQEGVEWVRRPIGNRWTKTFQTAARSSPLHSEIVRRTFEALFATPPSTVPSDISAMLALWLELCEEAETGVSTASARKWLEGALGGKTKAIAKKLLALPQEPSRLAAAAHAQAVAARWARAQRWTGFA